MSKNTLLLLLGLTFIVVGGVVVAEVLARPRDVVLRIEGMHCEGCMKNLEGSLRKVPGVQKVSVEFLTFAPPDADEPGSGKAEPPSSPIASADPSVDSADNPAGVSAADPETRPGKAVITVDGWSPPPLAVLIKAVEMAGFKARPFEY